MKIIKNKKRIFIIILSVVLVFLTNISYARYIKTEILNSTQEIAIPVFEIDRGEIIKIDKTNNAGFYEFSIRNFNDKNISEIGFLYIIEIVSDIGEAVEFELYDEDKQVQLKNLKTEAILIKGNEKVKKNYKLKVTYNNINKTKMNIIKNVQIKIYSEQEKV